MKKIITCTVNSKTGVMSNILKDMIILMVKKTMIILMMICLGLHQNVVVVVLLMLMDVCKMILNGAVQSLNVLILLWNVWNLLLMNLLMILLIKILLMHLLLVIEDYKEEKLMVTLLVMLVLGLEMLGVNVVSVL